MQCMPALLLMKYPITSRPAALPRAYSLAENILVFGIFLFNRNRFGQVTGLIYIATAHYRNMI
jgi:hypothetical protein